MPRPKGRGGAFGRYKKGGDKNKKRSERDKRADAFVEKKTKLDDQERVTEERKASPVYGRNTGVVLVSPDTAVETAQGILSPKDLSTVFEEIAEKAQEQFELGGEDQVPKRPPLSIPSDLKLSAVLDDERENVLCDMHTNKDYYFLTCRVPKPRKKAQVKKRAMMLRKRRIAKAKAIVGQLLGEAHGFTDAEVEECTLQYMNLAKTLVVKPGEDRQAAIATQTLLHMDCNVMSDKQVTNLLRATEHPWLTGAKVIICPLSPLFSCLFCFSLF